MVASWWFRDSQISFSVIHGWSAAEGPTTLAQMTQEDWDCGRGFSRYALKRGEPGHDDRKFLEAFTAEQFTKRPSFALGRCQQRSAAPVLERRMEPDGTQRQISKALFQIAAEFIIIVSYPEAIVRARHV
jgi:hypothetical protein